ncbi:MAG: PEP-CTERM sorting domain-containing protein [Phenylobacterium sp.]|nr:MAG: PEP-CTERM sorting domain-containing protein [Phenylobacterium sp.]
MVCHSNWLAGSIAAPARLGALALAVLTGGFALPGAARADCVEQMSRMPVSAPAAAAPAYRANMMRRGFAAAPAAQARARATKARIAGSAVRKARPARKAGVHRAARKPVAGLRRAAMAPAAAPRLPQPTSMPAAARDLATPRAFALIATTVCETGPRPAAAPVNAPGGEPGLPADGLFPRTDTETVLPPIIGPGFPGSDGPPTVVVPGGPGTEPPVIVPPVIGPPPVVAVPEPGTWALLILGFGLVGARMRRRPRLPA